MANDIFNVDLPALARRLDERLEALARIGVVPGVGMWRRPYTPEESEAVTLTRQWMEAAGMTVRRDAVGNLIGRVEGSESGPPIATGSHLDTVKNGGRFDGALGVVGGLGAVELLLEAKGRPRRPLEVIVFVGEEGSRFPPSLIGSRAMIGALTRADLEWRDEDGISLAEAMAAAGFDPERVGEAVRDDIGAFIELHIEQGPVLESESIPVGIVTGIVGLHQVVVTLTGQADHAGTTPIPLRRDPLVAAARMIVTMTEHIAREGSVVTVGRIEAQPGGSNIVPAQVRFTLDFRHPHPEHRLRLYSWLRATAERIAAEQRVEMAWDVSEDLPPVAMDEGLVGALASGAKDVGIETRAMTSGAGHDTMVLGLRFPTAMLFVPSRGGRSHSPEEWTDPIDAAKGLLVLAAGLARLAY